MLFYINPIDYETATTWLGPKFRQQVDENIKTIENFIPVLNLAFAVPAKHFDWHDTNYPNEHLFLSGKQIVTEKIVKWINE